MVVVTRLGDRTENSPRGLTLLDPDHRVVVTGEQLHQATLARYAPRGDGRPRRVAVELRFARSRIEVRLDGGRVGELTGLMSQRYAPHLDAVLRDGGRPGCVALVVHGRHGLVEMELRLPEPDAVPAHATGAPAPRPPDSGRPDPRRPDSGRPAPRPGRGPRGGRRSPSGPPGRLPRGARPWLVGGGVVALLIAVAAGIDSRSTAPEVPVVVAAPASTTRSAPPSTSTGPTTTGPSTVAAPTPSDVPDLPDVTEAPVAVPPAAATRAPEPAPERRAEPEPEAAGSSGCDANYGGCVPVANDVDCEGGSGNGPAYVAGPVRVTGSDVYGLDADDDGVGCE